MAKVATLFKGGELHLPDQKIIKAKDFSSLLDTLELIPTVENDVAEYKKEAVRQIEIEKEQAMLMGFEEGLEKWAEQLAYFQKETSAMKEGFESKIIPIAIAIAKKIIGYEIEQNEGVLALIKKALQSVTLHKRITVFVNKGDLELLEMHKEQFRLMFEGLEVFAFHEREDIDQGGCVIETEVGIIDARLSLLWESVEKSFTKLLKASQE